MRQLCVALTILFIALSAPSTSSAQNADFRVIPRIGYLAPRGQLFDWRAQALGSNRALRTTASVESSTAWGLSVEMSVLGGDLWIRGSFDRSTNQNTSATATEVTRLQGITFGPGIEVEHFEYASSSATTELGLDVVFPTRAELWGMKPFFSAGLGYRHYDLTGLALRDPLAAEPEDPSLFRFPEAESSGSYRIGAGFEVEIWGMILNLSLLDSIGEYQEEMKHNLIFSLGAPLVR